MESVLNFVSGAVITICDYMSEEFKDSKVLHKVIENFKTGGNLKVELQSDIDLKDLNGHLLISNHISQLDFAAVSKYIDCKVVTYLIDRSKTSDENFTDHGVISFNFLDPESGKFVREELTRRLKEGYNILLFPEGRILLKDNIGRPQFTGGIKVAYNNNIPILTIKLSYIDSNGIDITSEHNSYIDMIVYLGSLPVEPPIIKIEILKRILPSDYSTFDLFFDQICESYTKLKN